MLAVSSAVIPQELNYLLNPLHSHFKRIRGGRPLSGRGVERIGIPPLPGRAANSTSALLTLTGLKE